jgi:histidine ammonia-lyase
MSIMLNGSALTPQQLVAIVDTAAPVEIEPQALARAAQSRQTALAALERRPVYGRTTGVGANHSIATDPDAAATNGIRLIRSHAGGAGEFIGRRQSRAMMAVRANQLLVGTAGVEPELIEVIVDAVNSGAHPRMHEYGSIGTGDLTAMAEFALTLVGERDWVGPAQPKFAIDHADALPLLSSSALTIAAASLTYSDLARLAEATMVVAALSFLALRGSPEAFAERVHQARPHPGSVAVAARMRELVEPVGETSERVQDPYGLRAFPPVHGVLHDSIQRLRAVLMIELNAGAENPLVSIKDNDVYHHGNFHQAPLAIALDELRLALLGSAQLGVARIAELMEPRLTGLKPFLASGPTDSSGLMIAEYTAASALASLRSAATPVAFGSAVLSRGVEDHASFASLAARQSVDAASCYRSVLALELVAAIRALRLSDRSPSSAGLRSAFARADAVLPTETDDRPLNNDVRLAVSLVDELGH